MTITTRTELGVANALSVLTQSVSLWASSSAGRAPRLHRGGSGFESCLVHHLDAYGNNLWFNILSVQQGRDGPIPSSARLVKKI